MGLSLLSGEVFLVRIRRRRSSPSLSICPASTGSWRGTIQTRYRRIMVTSNEFITLGSLVAASGHGSLGGTSEPTSATRNASQSNLGGGSLQKLILQPAEPALSDFIRLALIAFRPLRDGAGTPELEASG